MSKFNLFSISGRLVKKISADDVESVLVQDDRLYIVLQDGTYYKGDYMEYEVPESTELRD
jgi:hypothetical protein